jgi:hypothetical protein
MMYYIRRYLHGLWKIRWWLPIAFLPLAIYLLFAAITPDRFTINQIIAVKRTAPIALSRSPIDIMKVETMGEVVSNPAGLFLDDFAIVGLSRNVEQKAHGSREEPASLNLRFVIEKSMSLKTVDDEHVLVNYEGNDLKMGRMMVNYFTQQLVSRSKDGLIRSTGIMNPTGMSLGNAPQPSQPAAIPDGNMMIQEHSDLWRSDRLLPAAVILACSLALLLILAGFVEWADQSFKSERQVARYLDVRVIGVMPDLAPLVRRIIN